MLAARAAALALVVAVLPAPLPTRAEEPAALRGDLVVDGIVTGAAAAFWAGSELAKRSLAPERCRFCQPNGLDAAARERLVLSWNGAAARTSDVLAFGILPLGAAAHQLLAARGAGASWEEGAKDTLYVAQAAALALSLNQIVKLTVGRERPFVHYGNYSEAGRSHDPDDDLSFYSGHTTLVFAVASAAGTVSDLRGYRSAPWVWGVGMTLAAVTGYARIAADKHWLTDVLVGAAAGTAFGVAVPRLLHGRESTAGGGPSLAVTPLPLGVAGTF